MANKKQSRGNCAYCGRELARGGMGRHLAGCDARLQAIARTHASGEAVPLIHLQVVGGWSGDHWLHLEVSGETTLKKLDGYLRAIWLECCGHLSAFSYPGRGGRDVGMARKVMDVLGPEAELEHVYDFGTSTVSRLKGLNVRRGVPTTRHPIALMARNVAPAYDCQECGAPATSLCMECVYDDQPGTLCDEHAEDHPHEEYGSPMALVNSPRAGQCGYDGPAEPPY